MVYINRPVAPSGSKTQNGRLLSKIALNLKKGIHLPIYPCKYGGGRRSFCFVCSFHFFVWFMW